MSKRGPNSGLPFCPTEGETARFWERVDKSGECWLWTGSRVGHYGALMLSSVGRPVHAHRIGYRVGVGPIPAGMSVCHHCDNPLCVRPDHLFLGTHTDNMRDMRDKDRAGVVMPDRRCRAGHFFTKNVAVAPLACDPTRLRECALCLLIEEQQRVRESYYRALSEYGQHVTSVIMPLLPPADDARKQLTDREFDILARHLGVWGREPESFTVLAYAYGVSRQRIEQIRDAALKTLCVPLDAIDQDIAARFGQAAAGVNVIPGSRKRRSRIPDEEGAAA